MKRLTCAALILLLALALCACGGEKEPSSPYLGVWTATSAQFGGADIEISEVFTDGMILELKDNGICQLTLGEQSDTATWSAADGSITISDGETDLVGTIDESAVVLDISGMYITLTRDGAGAAENGAGAEASSGEDAEDGAA